MAWINVIQSQSVTEELNQGLPPTVYYLANIDVNMSSGIDKELFVVRVDDDTFVNVATVADINTYPKYKNDAITDGLGFYRVKSITIKTLLKELTLEGATDVQQRLQLVVKSWAADSGTSFGGVEAFLYTSDI